MIYSKKNWQQYSGIVLQRIKTEIKIEAVRGYLGILWWIIEPLMYMSVFYFVFAHMFNRGGVEFVMYLLCGLIIWKWLSTTILLGSSSLILHAGLMNQVCLPKIIFPLTNIAVNTIKFLVTLIILLLLLYFVGSKASLTWFVLPVIIFITFLFISSLTLFFAAVIPFFPDFRGILENLLLMVFFLSGIFFDVRTLPENIQSVFFLNPVAFLIATIRNVLLDNTMPNWNGLFLICVGSIVICVASFFIFQRYDRVYPKIIFM